MSSSAVNPDIAVSLSRPLLFENPDRLVRPTPWAGHIPFAFWIVDVHRPAILVELGTHAGNSYSAFLQAIQRLRISTQCYAIDTWKGDEQAGFYGDEVYEEFSRYHDARFADFSRLIRSTFEQALDHFENGSIDLLHIDGLHTLEAVTHDFESWLPKLSPRGVVLFHDIDVKENRFGVWKLWADLCKKYPHFSFHHSHGLGVLGVGESIGGELSMLFSLDREPLRAHDGDFVRVYFERLGSTLIERIERAELEAKLPNFDRLHADLLELSRQTSVLREHVGKQDQQFVELTHEVAARDAELAALKSRCAELEAEIANSFFKKLGRLFGRRQ